MFGSWRLLVAGLRVGYSSSDAVLEESKSDGGSVTSSIAGNRSGDGATEFGIMCRLAGKVPSDSRLSMERSRRLDLKSFME